MSSSENAFASAMHAYQAGNLLDAEHRCREIVRLDPAHAEACHLLSLVYQRQGDPVRAREQASRAVTLAPANARYHSTLGTIHLERGDIKAALASFRQATRLDPGLADAWYSTGLILHKTGQQHAAVQAYERALQVQPGHPGASGNLGAIYHVTGALDQAADCYRKALAADPGNHRLEYNLAHACLEKDPAGAEVHLRHTLSVRPDFPDAWFTLGLSLTAQGKQRQALECFAQVLRLQPGNTEAHNNTGILRMGLGDHKGAIEAYRKALTQRPNDARIHFNIGTSLKEAGQYPAAIESFQNALRLERHFPKAQAELCRCHQIICDWNNSDCTTERLVELVKSSLESGAESPVYPFDALSLPFTAELQREIAASHARIIRRKAVTAGRYEHGSGNNNPARLRIGYVSQKFNDHAGAHLIASLFGLHDRERFEIFAYSIGADDGSQYRRRIVQGCDHFLDMRDNSYTEIARRIHEDQIDILVDLGVYNTHCRTEIFALRPAPVQVSYLGYPGTSGADFYDYILTDRVVTPPDQQAWYTEKFAYLPYCYQVNDHQLEIPRETPARQECGLPDSGFVFCSFNNSYKIEPAIFEVWMRILDRVPGAVLWLLEHSPATTQNLRREAGMRGIDDSRLIFAARQPKPRHLARQRLAGLFLDTLTYNAHTTASDALRVGVPVLTVPGTTFASRVAASLLQTLAIHELIATNLAQYEEIAVEFATKNQQAGQICKKLTTNLNSSPLFDTPGFARNLERLYERMWSLYRSGGSPEQLMPEGVQSHAYLPSRRR